MNTPRTKLTSEEQIRYLLWHPESQDLFVLNSHRGAKQAAAEGCENVTGDAFYESCFVKKVNPAKHMIERVEYPGTAGSELPLHVKYRPASLSTVLGQDPVVHSLTKALEAKTRPHTFLFTGPSGCGKTTLARIVASVVGCSPENIVEADAATNTGIDAARELTSTLRYKGFGDSPNKAIILDETHMLSKQAFASLLKSIEEPPEHVYFILCTTDEGKIPEAIKTRCVSYNLKPVKYDSLMDLLELVVEREKMDPVDGLLPLIARACNGSPRQALVMLAMTASSDDLEEAAVLLESPLESKEIIDLCRLLVKGDLDWRKVTDTLKAIPEQNAESIRIVIVNYINSCLMGAKSEGDIIRLLDIQSQFTKPCNTSDKLAPILLAFGNIIYP